MPSIIPFNAISSRSPRSKSILKSREKKTGKPAVVSLVSRASTGSSCAHEQESKNIAPQFDSDQEEVLQKTPTHLLARMYLCKAVDLLAESGEDEKRLSWLIEDCVSIMDGRALQAQVR